MKNIYVSAVSLVCVVILLVIFLPGVGPSDSQSSIVNDGIIHYPDAQVGDFRLYVAQMDMCAQMIEDVYEDEEYVYSFSCLMSGRYIFERNNKTYSIREVLSGKMLTTQQVMDVIPGLSRREKTNEGE